MTRSKPRSGSATVRIFISVVEQVSPESVEITNEATQQEPDSGGVRTESADMALQEASDEKGAQAGDNVDTANAEAAIKAAQQSIDASGIGATDGLNTASTLLLENVKGLSEILKSVLDIVVEKIDVLAKVNYLNRYASYYFD